MASKDQQTLQGQDQSEEKEVEVFKFRPPLPKEQRRTYKEQHYYRW